MSIASCDFDGLAMDKTVCKVLMFLVTSPLPRVPEEELEPVKGDKTIHTLTYFSTK